MIFAEFREPTADKQYATVATIRIMDGGELRLTGEHVQELTEVPIRDLDRPNGQLRFDDDPVAWVRNVNRAFRTGYLVPVVVTDTHPVD